MSELRSFERKRYSKSFLSGLELKIENVGKATAYNVEVELTAYLDSRDSSMGVYLGKFNKLTNLIEDERIIDRIKNMEYQIFWGYLLVWILI